MTAFRLVVSVMPRPGILDPQGRAVERALPQLEAGSVRDVRVGRRVEMTVEAGSEAEARAVAERLASGLLSNPLVEEWRVQMAGPPPVAVEAAR